jgi:5-methylthioadenosine/S-adenosylhomocysteine deaminase
MRRLLIRGATLLTMDARLGDFEQGDLLVEGSRIAAVGARIEADPDGTEVVDASGMIVLPGFVNAHVHLWEIPLRGLGGDWISSRDYHGNVHRNLATRYEADDVHVANLIGSLNQINGGTTTVLDWCHVVRDAAMTDAAIDGIAATGLRAVFARGTHKPPPDGSGTSKPYWEVPYPREELIRLRRGRLSSDEGRITLGMATLGPDIATYEVARDEMHLAREFGIVHSAHTWGRRGKRRNEDGLWRLAKEGLLGPDHNIAHGNGLDDDELKMVLDHGCSITATDLAEMMNSERIGMLGRVAKAGGMPSLGTDVCVYFNSAMLLELRHAFAHQREADNRELAARGTWPSEHHATRTRDAVEWATIGGAKALRLDHRIGSLTPGKEADLILVDTRTMNVFPAVPGGDPYHVVVLHAENSDVHSVMIGGDWVKRDGRLLFDPDALARHQAALLESRRALMARGDYRYRPEPAGERP